MQDLPKSWRVLYTKHNTELLVAERLKSIDFETYVPTKTELRHWSASKKTVKVPSLPSMVLVSIKPKDFNKVFKKSEKNLTNFYKSVISASTLLAPTIKVVQAFKVTENSQRNINIAFVNEFRKYLKVF